MTIISVTIPSVSSNSTTLARKREKFQLLGTARTGSAGAGYSTRIRPVSASRTNCANGLHCTGKVANPHALSRAGLRDSSRSMASGLGCWNTTAASSAFHIARTG